MSSLRIKELDCVRDHSLCLCKSWNVFLHILHIKELECFLEHSAYQRVVMFPWALTLHVKYLEWFPEHSAYQRVGIFPWALSLRIKELECFPEHSAYQRVGMFLRAPELLRVSKGWTISVSILRINLQQACRGKYGCWRRRAFRICHRLDRWNILP